MQGKSFIGFGVFWIFILNVQVHEINAQETYSITGYIVDVDSGEPIPYASVGVPEQQRGISANIHGYFRLILPDINQSHHLKISCIGYQQKSILFSDIDWKGDQRFELIPEPTVLDEIVIVGKSQTLEELVKRTSKNRKVYLRSTPYLMNGFYREVLKIDGTHKGLTEAQGILYMNGYDSGYKNNQQHLTYDLAQWKHIRRSEYPDHTGKYLEVVALLKAKDFYLHDGPLHRKNLDKLKYNISDSSLYQDRLVLVIDFEPKKEFSKVLSYKGRMYVKEDDQALLRLELQARGPEPFLRNIDSQGNVTTSFEINFSLFNGQYYLNHTSFTRSYDEDGHSLNWQLELIGESFSNQSAMFLNYNQRVVLYSEMLNPKINYNPDFWDDLSFSQGYDFRKMSDLDGGLESQFRNKNNQRLTPLPEGIESYEQMSNNRNVLDFLMQR